jgi:hypothetical protein
VRADLTALAAMDVLVLNDGALVYVTSESAVYEWLTFSVSAVSSPTVIAPMSPPAGKTNGRWHKVVTDWTYGAGGTNLGQKTTGYLKAVEAYSVDEGPDAAIERVFGKTPSVLVQFTGDAPVSDSGLRGAFYKTTLNFQLLITTPTWAAQPRAPRSLAPPALSLRYILAIPFGYPHYPYVLDPLSRSGILSEYKRTLLFA